MEEESYIYIYIHTRVNVFPERYTGFAPVRLTRTVYSFTFREKLENIANDIITVNVQCRR